MSPFETAVASLHADFSGQLLRLDRVVASGFARITAQLDRIERRP